MDCHKRARLLRSITGRKFRNWFQLRWCAVKTNSIVWFVLPDEHWKLMLIPSGEMELSWRHGQQSQTQTNTTHEWHSLPECYFPLRMFGEGEIMKSYRFRIFYFFLCASDATSISQQWMRLMRACVNGSMAQCLTHWPYRQWINVNQSEKPKAWDCCHRYTFLYSMFIIHIVLPSAVVGTEFGNCLVPRGSQRRRSIVCLNITLDEWEGSKCNPNVREKENKITENIQQLRVKYGH